MEIWKRIKENAAASSEMPTGITAWTENRNPEFVVIWIFFFFSSARFLALYTDLLVSPPSIFGMGGGRSLCVGVKESGVPVWRASQMRQRRVPPCLGSRTPTEATDTTAGSKS